jgi:hypothetical protein
MQSVFTLECGPPVVRSMGTCSLCTDSQTPVFADIKVIAELRDKHTKEVKLTVEKYLTPHVIVDAAPTPDTGPQHAAEYKEEDNSNVVPMNIAATLELRKEKASSVSAPPAVIAAGFDTPLLRRPGLLRLGLEVSLDKNDLYPTRLSFALVPICLVV